jgi:hypothetical protein
VPAPCHPHDVVNGCLLVIEGPQDYQDDMGLPFAHRKVVRRVVPGLAKAPGI